MSWANLQLRFRNIVEKAGGPNKGSSGCIDIEFDFDGEVSVTLGTYDIGNWERHTEIGTFSDEESAMIAVSEKLDEAERVVQEDLEQCENQPSLPRTKTNLTGIIEKLSARSSQNEETCIICEQEINEDGECDCPEKDEPFKPGLLPVRQRKDECLCFNQCTCGRGFSYGLK